MRPCRWPSLGHKLVGTCALKYRPKHTADGLGAERDAVLFGTGAQAFVNAWQPASGVRKNREPAPASGVVKPAATATGLAGQRACLIHRTQRSQALHDVATTPKAAAGRPTGPSPCLA